MDSMRGCRSLVIQRTWGVGDVPPNASLTLSAGSCLTPLPKAVPIRKKSTRPNAPAVDRRAGNKVGRVTAPRRYRMLWRSMRTSELISHSEIESVVVYRAALALDVRFQDHVLMRPIIYADVGLILVAVGATAGFVVPRIVARDDAEPRSDFIRRFNVPATLLVATRRRRPSQSSAGAPCTPSLPPRPVRPPDDRCARGTRSHRSSGC